VFVQGLQLFAAADERTDSHFAIPEDSQMNRRFQMVDVFHSTPLSGNPLAVVFDADGLTTEEMQRMTRWFNLSETSFLLPPTTNDADYRVRIFTLERELPFAGHPTLGTCHAWLTAGGRPRSSAQILQECAAGLIPIRRDTDRLAFAAPNVIRSGPVEAAKLDEIATALQIKRSDIVDSQWVDNGPGWVAVQLASAEAVLAVQPAGQHPTRIDIGVVGFYPAGAPLAYEVRAIFSDHRKSLMEDPVTGSLNASLAQWLLATGRAKAPYVASQGARLGRAGRIYLDLDANGTVWAGGKSTTIVLGHCSI
jgi:PhzF family phenazine biosynthesis protein